MEQKRTIWIVLAAGIFLLVVIGTAVIIHSGDVKKDTSAIVQNEKGTVWMSPDVAQSRREDFLANNSVSSPVEEKKEEPVVAETPSVTTSMASPAEGTTQIENMTVIATGNTNVYTIGAEGPATIDLNGNGGFEPAENAPAAKTSAVTAKNAAAEVAIRETNTVRRNVETSDVLVENKYREESNVVAKASSNKTATVKKAPAPATSKKAAPVKTAAKTSASVSTEKVPDRFWVQCASYSAKKNADEAKATLEEKKIQCEVFTFTDGKGELHYRLRVGPYTTKGEADYWKKRIDEMPQFAKNGTFVTNTSK
ncbi:SPOR domain-containing protein [Treponema sp.]|uniref:SPOR domain-containing protein n=1 Tax=Treponema sp. TaxID=166 RepID=UPI00298E8D29|nr:SPOR domain-containing protein [Treponema sp.]MCQ2241612.1 SPOR domain-containing protein [Treponema sp.]